MKRAKAPSNVAEKNPGDCVKKVFLAKIFLVDYRRSSGEREALRRRREKSAVSQEIFQLLHREFRQRKPDGCAQSKDHRGVSKQPGNPAAKGS
ncbi:hypothetical protein AMTR_s00053p00227070 [Amborella trichopoda]|uniref:Uncharacterized protein n=1 Tax=Amborella trichopoda TaxID=13333 RepID=W1PBY0_AMBTC|nr:hypothetical protein AMTR_s00053p00227070 [Amborella trichopoda]